MFSPLIHNILGQFLLVWNPMFVEPIGSKIQVAEVHGYYITPYFLILFTVCERVLYNFGSLTPLHGV